MEKTTAVKFREGRAPTSDPIEDFFRECALALEAKGIKFQTNEALKEKAKET